RGSGGLRRWAFGFLVHFGQRGEASLGDTIASDEVVASTILSVPAARTAVCALRSEVRALEHAASFVLINPSQTLSAFPMFRTLRTVSEVVRGIRTFWTVRCPDCPDCPCPS